MNMKMTITMVGRERARARISFDVKYDRMTIILLIKLKSPFQFAQYFAGFLANRSHSLLDCTI